MNTLEALLSGIVADPLEETRWLVPADWLEENDDPRRAELLRLHRRLVNTCCEPDAHPERVASQTRLVELLVAGIVPCMPRHTLTLPGGVPLVGAFVPPGSFLMGGTVADDEKPVHRVTLTHGFFMGVHPVTQAQWHAVMDTDPSGFSGPTRPVVKVSWDDCREFSTKLTAHLKGRATVRLPTEAEWEYACRAGTTTEYHFGDVIGPGVANYNGDYSWNGSLRGTYRQQRTAAGAFPPNAWGLYDVHGNVREWCADAYGAYPSDGDGRNIEAADDVSRVLRGGSYLCPPSFCRAAYRFGHRPADRENPNGFRICFRLD